MTGGNIHTTRDGRKIPFEELDTPHLLNILRMIERKAREGVKVQQGGGSSPDDFWYETYIVKGDAALKKLNYYKYLKEYKRRIPPAFKGFDELRESNL